MKRLTIDTPKGRQIRLAWIIAGKPTEHLHPTLLMKPYHLSGKLLRTDRIKGKTNEQTAQTLFPEKWVKSLDNDTREELFAIISKEWCM